MMTRNELATAQARHNAGQCWYDGPELFIPEHNGSSMGIGTRDELDALKADGIIPATVTYRAVVPSDLA